MTIELQVLASKNVIASFLVAPLSSSVIEKFEDEFAKGREWYDDWNAHVDTTLRSSASIEELAQQCKLHFVSEANPYNPFFFIVLDERTPRDGSVILCQQGDPTGDFYEPVDRLRISPASIAMLVANLAVGNKDIPSIIGNDAPEEPEALQEWFNDVPADHSDRQSNTRVPVSAFQSAHFPGPDTPFVTLSLEPDHVGNIPQMPQGKAVRLVWFGQCPARILLSCIWDAGDVERRHVTGVPVKV